jgi:hypothetical protein
MRAALVEAGASADTAETAAADVGELTGEIRVIKWMLGVLVAMTAGLYAVLFQIAFRLS